MAIKTKNMKITIYKYEKVAVKDTELFIPQEPFYCFETGIRRSIRIIPEILKKSYGGNAKKGDVYSLQVTCVHGSFECKIDHFNIQISQIEDLVNRNEKSNEASIIQMLLNEDYNLRTKEDFNNDLQNAINQITGFE